ncbi:lipocalin-like domain-containing protein [uncultured Bradyrhizobium sp.]|uniref:lipocalin-like domain-containing protein n=1 Tax=uncultured Bradyrhizobium sp. TaxID=199684 RepID=UPI0035CA45D1
MSADFRLSRRGFAGGLAFLALSAKSSFAQGFAGLGTDAGGFASVVPGNRLTFPGDLGPHPEFRIEWWYITANLKDSNDAAYGVQWTLFRQALAPGAQQQGWASPQIWMGHAAMTRADTHRFSETFARGGVGQAGVEAKPFRAWIDSWEMRGLDGISDTTVAPLELKASGADFSYVLRLDAERPLVLQGDAGFSRKSERGQASYYYSQPYFKAQGIATIDDKPVQLAGLAWLDREWSSQPLASDQTGWDWFSLHLEQGEKLMLFRLRQTDGQNYFSGNWITNDGKSTQIASDAITMTPTASTDVAGRSAPTQWTIIIPSRGLNIQSTPLNARSWMATSFPYWEGPISFRGSHTGVGYLEMTGY